MSYRAVVEGQQHDRTEIVPVHVWERAEYGAAVPVEYLPGRPETVRVATDDPRAARQSVIFTAIGAVLLLGGLYAATRAVKWRPPVDEPAAAAPPIAVHTHEASFWPRARQSAEFWLGAIFLVVSTPFVIITLVQIAEEARFARNGVSTDGMILTKEIKPARRNRKPGYEATYRLMVPEGAFENRAQLPFDVWSRLRERQSVEVRYLPERPAMSRLTGSREWVAAAVLGLVGFLMFGVGAVVFRGSIRRAQLQWRLERRGAAANGTVIEVRDRNVAINGIRQWRLSYQYDDFQSRRYTATHDMPEDEAQLWSVGDVGAVRYDPGRPADAIWLGRPT